MNFKEELQVHYSPQEDSVLNEKIKEVIENISGEENTELLEKVDEMEEELKKAPIDEKKKYEIRKIIREMKIRLYTIDPPTSGGGDPDGDRPKRKKEK